MAKEATSIVTPKIIASRDEMSFVTTGRLVVLFICSSISASCRCRSARSELANIFRSSSRLRDRSAEFVSVFIPGISLASLRVSFAKLSLVLRFTSEPCPPAAVQSVIPATVKSGLSLNCIGSHDFPLAGCESERASTTRIGPEFFLGKTIICASSRNPCFCIRS